MEGMMSTMGHGHGGMDMGHGDMGMIMTFWRGDQVELLFKGWKTTGPGTYAGACVIVILFACLAVFMKVCRIELERLLLSLGQQRDTTGKIELEKNLMGKNLLGKNLLGMFLRFIIAFLTYGADYLLMLVVMTYNVGMFLSVLTGLGLGVAVFGQYVSPYYKRKQALAADEDARQPLYAGNQYCDCPCSQQPTKYTSPTRGVRNDSQSERSSMKINQLDPACCSV